MARSRIKGLGKVRKKLRNMPEEIQAQVRHSVRRSAQELVFEWQKAAPVSSDFAPNDWQGRSRKKLRDAFEYRISRDGLSARTGLLGKSSQAFFFWRFLEFGTRNDPDGSPFVWPVWRSVRKKIRRDVRNSVVRGFRTVARSNPADT